MKRAIAWLPVALAASLASGFAAAWLAPVRASSEAVPPAVAPAIQHGGRAIAAAAFELGALRDSAPLETKEAPDGAAPSAPLEPDVAETFRRELTAIVWRKGRPHVVLVDPAAKTGRRVLGVGAAYRSGWKVRAISEANVELRRGRDRRRIDVFTPPISDEPGTDEGALAIEPAPRRFLARDPNASTQKE
jgi:hypothetical protein